MIKLTKVYDSNYFLLISANLFARYVKENFTSGALWLKSSSVKATNAGPSIAKYSSGTI